MKLKKLDDSSILKKDFNISMPGYNTFEVDYFLDQIIEDYKYYNNYVETLNFENDTNLKIIESLHQKINKLEMNNKLLLEKLKDLDNLGYNNLEIIKRINVLEEALNQKIQTSSTDKT